MTRGRSVLLLAAPVLAAGCGHSAPTTLHAIMAVPPARPVAAYAGAPVRVDAVKLPPAIDRIDMLRETGAGRYQVLEFDRWAAPPARLARQALAEDLSIRLPPGAVVATAGADAPPVTAIAVDILSFDVTADGAVMVVNWQRGCGPGGDVRRQHLRLDAPAADAPAALARLIGALADRIAADLAASPEPCSPPRH